VYYFTRLRRRAFHLPITHVFVTCVQHADGSYSLAQSKPKEWDFITPSTLAAHTVRKYAQGVVRFCHCVMQHVCHVLRQLAH
jgi:hypothetical protein